MSDNFNNSSFMANRLSAVKPAGDSVVDQFLKDSSMFYGLTGGSEQQQVNPMALQGMER